MISGRNAAGPPEARQSPARGRAGTGRVPIILFMVVYAAVILYSPALFPLDDHEFLRTIQVGKNLPFYVIPDIGRFHPLTAQEYNLLSRIDTSPALYFAFNAFQFVAIGWAFIRLMSDGGAHTSSSVPWLFVLFSLSPGFVSAWFRFQVSERGALFFFVLFLVCYRGIQRTPNAWWFVSAVAAANLALYYKEPGFLMLATFAILRLASQWRGQPRITAGLDSWLLVSCFIFVVAYIALIHVHKRDLDYADFHTRAFGETLLAYVINDPLLVLEPCPSPLSASSSWGGDGARGTLCMSRRCWLRWCTSRATSRSGSSARGTSCPPTPSPCLPWFDSSR